MIQNVTTYGYQSISIEQFEKEMQQEGLFPIVVKPEGADYFIDARIYRDLTANSPEHLFKLFYKTISGEEWQESNYLSCSGLLKCFANENIHSNLGYYLLSPDNILGCNPAEARKHFFAAGDFSGVALSYYDEGRKELAISYLEDLPPNALYEKTLINLYLAGTDIASPQPKKALEHCFNLIKEEPFNHEFMLKAAEIILHTPIKKEVIRGIGYCQRVLEDSHSLEYKAHAHYLLSLFCIRKSPNQAFHHLIRSIPYSFAPSQSQNFTNSLKDLFSQEFTFNEKIDLERWTDEQKALHDLLQTAAFRHRKDLTPKECFNLCYKTSSELEPYILKLDVFIADTIPYVSAMIALAKIRFGNKSHKDYEVFKTSDPEAYKFYQEVFKNKNDFQPEEYVQALLVSGSRQQK